MMCRPLACSLAALLLLTSALLPAADAPTPAPAPAPAPAPVQAWLHPQSPFRARFTIKTQPTQKRAGYYLEVPVCGLGDVNGKDIQVYSETGQHLNVFSLGKGRPNEVLLQVVGDDNLKGSVVAYFGSGQPAPQAEGKFTPGLTVRIRSCPPDADLASWDKSKKLLDASEVWGTLPVQQISLGTNPIDTTEAFAIEYTGSLWSEKAESISLVLASDDAGYLFVNDQKIIDRSGRHSGGDANGEDGHPVALRQGLNPLHCVVLSPAPPACAALYLWKDKRDRSLLPASAFVQAGQTELAKMEARADVPGCPAFRLQQLGYIAMDDWVLTEVYFASHTDTKVDWLLQDGSRGLSSSWLRLVAGTRSLKISATVPGGKPVASGLLTFALVPAQKSWTDWPTYEHFTQLIEAQSPKQLDGQTLSVYYQFLLLYERNPHLVPVARELVERLPKDRKVDRRERDLILNYARAAAATELATARDAYAQLLRGRMGKEEGVILNEALELELYRAGDATRAAKLLTQVEIELGKDEPLVILNRGLLALLGGDKKGADAAFGVLRAKASKGNEFRENAVQGNAALERFRLRLQGGFFALAEEDLRSWGTDAPEALVDGEYILRRAQWMRRLGWHANIPKWIDAALAYNDLPAFLPDLELERAFAQEALGQAADARKTYEKILASYPNHPAALTAKAKLK